MKSLAKSFSFFPRNSPELLFQPNGTGRGLFRLIASYKGRYLIVWGTSKAECVRKAESRIPREWNNLNTK